MSRRLFWSNRSPHAAERARARGLDESTRLLKAVQVAIANLKGAKVPDQVRFAVKQLISDARQSVTNLERTLEDA